MRKKVAQNVCYSSDRYITHVKMIFYYECSVIHNFTPF